MATLDWIGNAAVVNHHRTVPYRLLQCDRTRSAGDPDSGNLLVQGANLLALKALLPYYAGKATCIYIDPPYNTGNENWVYNDNVNSLEIREWLGQTVGKEAEDLRHLHARRAIPKWGLEAGRRHSGRTNTSCLDCDSGHFAFQRTR
jgi:16S rRNA G966 N2-methylase RsmD